MAENNPTQNLKALVKGIENLRAYLKAKHSPKLLNYSKKIFSVYLLQLLLTMGNIMNGSEACAFKITFVTKVGIEEDHC